MNSYVSNMQTCYQCGGPRQRRLTQLGPPLHHNNDTHRTYTFPHIFRPLSPSASIICPLPLILSPLSTLYTIRIHGGRGATGGNRNGGRGGAGDLGL